MKRTILIPLALAALTACATTSISDPHGENRLYRGELSEFDVLGIDPGAYTTDAEIQRSFDRAEPVRLRKDSRILLIQSGAMIPDAPMREALGRCYRVTPFSGIPEAGAGANYSRNLRLAAARGGYESIVCYWGTLESAKRNYATKTISWVPIVGWMVPDEKKEMRMRLSFVVVDVRTGAWTSVPTEPVTSSRVSHHYSRDSSDVRLVERLKNVTYERAAKDLTARLDG